MGVYPRFAVGKYFLFPDRYRLLYRINDVPAGIERVCAVGRRYADQYRNLANPKRAFSVDDNTFKNSPSLAGLLNDLAHLTDRHPVVGFVFEMIDGPLLGIVAYHTQEKIDGSSLIGLQQRKRR